jgi:putative glutamine amidotransferase
VDETVIQGRLKGPGFLILPFALCLLPFDFYFIRMHPLIGITCTTTVGSSWSVNSLGRLQDAVYRNYTQAVEFCGGAPVLIPALKKTAALESILAKLDGLILSGGHDVNPRFYGEEPLLRLEAIDADRDFTEMELTRMALEMDIPILGICRGIQVLNVVCGGTLYQDLPSQKPNCLKHRQDADMQVHTHRVNIERDSLLYQIFKKDELWINSRHHQAVKDVAPGYRSTAVAKDGVIEGIEDASHKFVLGVQWHPEGNWDVDEDSQKLFRALVEATIRL